MPTAADGTTGAKALRQARLIALALIAGQVLFLGVAAALIVSGAVEPGPADRARALEAACLLVFAVLLPVAFLLRRRLHAIPDDAVSGEGAGARVADAARDGGAPDAGAPSAENLLKGHVLFFALCEMVTILSLVAALVQGALVPYAILALLCMGVQATNVPRTEAP